MSFASPAIVTSLALLGPDARFDDRGEYVRVESPEQPQAYYSTLLAFRSPPRAGDELAWRERWRAEFADAPNVRHETYVWEGGDADPAALAAFEAAGFDHQRDEILACERVAPPQRPALDVVVRPVTSEADWEGALALETFDPPPGVTHEMFRSFRAQRLRARRALVESGQGTWYGAYFADGTLAANLGIYLVADIARFQAVGTAIAFRRRGIAATLVHGAAAMFARERSPARFLMVADPQGPAIAMYRSLGFAAIGRTWALFRAPQPQA